MLAFACYAAGDQGCEDGIGSVEAGCQVGYCDAYFAGWTVARACDVHEAHFAVDHRQYQYHGRRK